jgi:hypothetical protein
MIGVYFGDKLVLVDSDIFHTVHDELAEHFRAMGLTGDALDMAIVTNLRPRLAEVLGELCSTRH